jgi:NAD(P)-dependent dehydrogenase (short-subunit alcohol dehydrogenase family)
MPLENKNAVIYGAAGAIGSAVARAFSREGAKVFLTGRHVGSLEVAIEVANMAAFMASDQASAATGTAVNLTCGAIA